MSASTLFIPDISGFTRFVKQTEIQHSQHIIEELINLIIKEGSNMFKVAEIEGDAVFFFKHGEKLTIEQVTAEAKRIYLAFHQHLLNYQHRRICNCGACTSAANLELKFVVHAGEIALANFSGDKGKPYGEAVIVAHRLLKTKIGHSEYLLLSEDFADDATGDGMDCYEDPELGKTHFSYTFLQDWKKELKPIIQQTENTQYDIVASATQTLPFEMEIVYDFIADFRYRGLWNREADQILFDENQINQAGTEHLCIINGKDLNLETIKPKAEPGQESYGEILKNPAPFKYFENSFILTPLNGETRVELRLFASFKWRIQKLISGFIRKKFSSQAAIIMEHLNEALAEHVKEVEAA